MMAAAQNAKEGGSRVLRFQILWACAGRARQVCLCALGQPAMRPPGLVFCVQ